MKIRKKWQKKRKKGRKKNKTSLFWIITISLLNTNTALRHAITCYWKTIVGKYNYINTYNYINIHKYKKA